MCENSRVMLCVMNLKNLLAKVWRFLVWISFFQNWETLQYKNALRKWAISQWAHWWQRWFCKCTKESQSHTSNFTRDSNSSLFGIPYCSSEFEVEMLEEASCARTRCCKLCVAPNSDKKIATAFSSIRCGVHIFHWRACVKASGRHFQHWSDRLLGLLCFAFISNSAVANFSVGVCCVTFMSPVAAFSAIKQHASIESLLQISFAIILLNILKICQEHSE